MKNHQANSLIQRKSAFIFFFIILIPQNNQIVQVYLPLKQQSAIEISIIIYFRKMSWFTRQEPKYPSNHHSSGYSKQTVNSKQKLIQDQNFSTQTFMGLMSTLQSLVLCFQGRHQSQYNDKMFKHYDRVNYSSKNVDQLKSQLQTQILVFQASRKVFAQENPNQTWTLPKNFDHNQASQFLNKAYELFKNNDEASSRMVADIVSILQNKFDGLYSETAQLKPNYTAQQRAGFKNNLVSNGIFSGLQMDKRQSEAKHYKDVSDIRAKINTNSDVFAFDKKKPNNQMIIEEQQLKQNEKRRYLVFTEFQKTYIDKLSLGSYVKNLQHYHIKRIERMEDIEKNKFSLMQNNFTYVLPIVMNENYQLKWKGQIQDLRSISG